MTANLQPLFWDSCVFIRYLIGDESLPCFNDVCRFVDEARSGKRQIFYSTLIYAEIREDFIIQSGDYRSIREFFADLGGSFEPIDPNPNILMAVGELRSARSVNPDPRGNTRAIGTADAVMLMSALFTRDVLGVENLEFHSFDEGSGKSWEGKCVPLVGFDKWFPVPNRTPRVVEVCGLAKRLPVHPEPLLDGVVVHGRFNKSQHRD